ncbi:centromere protein J isoform X2 [Colossoma macropomum]|uniref:centromere protein J isoform X2 n=1 Tax=Colossoma macropomum TaxID=42526 RepID=UPI0018642259|nr:centromere protein J isoform X2 [Colossoma macropomum]
MSAKIPHTGAPVTPAEQDRSSEQKSDGAPLSSCFTATGEEIDREKREEAENAPVVRFCPVSSSEAVNHGGVQQGALNSQLTKCRCRNLKTHRSPQEEQLLQLQLQQMQKVLHEQNTLLSFLAPGLMLSPTFLTQGNGYSPTQSPEVDLAVHTGSLPNSRKDSSNTVLSRIRMGSEEPACASQPTPQSDCIPSKPVGAEQRRLSPVEEESSESVEEECSMSPFGVRRKPLADPEERPIRPGLKEQEKTFEDLVEEQLKVDKEVQRSDKQITTEVTVTEKRNFLRKGDGRSRIGKSRDIIQKIQPVSCSQQAKNMNSAQQQRHWASLLQHSDKEIWMSCSLHTKQRCLASQDSLRKTKDEGKYFSHQRSSVDRPLNSGAPLCDIKKQGPGDFNRSSNRNQSPFFSHALTQDESSSSQKSEELSKEPKRSSELQNERLRQSYAKHSDSKGDLKARPHEERVSFKKINDRIVRVSERRGHSPNTANAEPGIESLSLTTEVMQLLLDSNSSGNTSAEDDFESLKLPVPPNTSRLNCNDQNLDLSDEDYASDAPSETGDCPPDKVRTSRCLSAQFSSSSSSEEASDSELQCLSWSETEKVKETAKRSVLPECKRETERNSDSKILCNSNLLTKIFPQIKSTRKDNAEVGGFNTQQSTNGREPPKKVKGNSGLEIRAAASSYFMMDKMKKEQDKALTFIRAEMDQFANNGKDTPRSLPHPPDEGTVDIYKAQDLRQQIQSLTAQLKERECEWWQVHSKLQSHVDALTRENQLLLSHINPSEHKRPNHSTGRSTPHPETPSMSAECREVAAHTGSVPYRRSSTPALSPWKEATARNTTNGNSIINGQEKNEWTNRSIRKDSSNSTASTASYSLAESDTVPSSNYGGKGLCQPAERQIGVKGDRSRSSVPERTHSTSTRKTTSPESEHGSADMMEAGLLDPETKSSYTQEALKSSKAVVREEIRYPDGKIEQLLSDGSRVIVFRNGTKKEIGVDQRSVTVTFFNGDVKRTLPDGTVVYFYSDAQTTHSTYPSGLEILQFPNNQKEKHYPDGRREIFFPDGTVKNLYPDGRQESVFRDGTVVKLSKNGEKTVEFPNGQREIHTPQYKQRVYPDGTVKTVFLNGRQETKYSSGRVCLKNHEVVIITDKN